MPADPDLPLEAREQTALPNPNVDNQIAAVPFAGGLAALILHCLDPVGPFMTLRILVEIDEDETTVAPHGRLSGEGAAEVERVTSEQDEPLRIDLTHLTGVDADGLQTLRRLRERGAQVTEASPYIEMMLERAGEDPGPAETHRPVK